MSEATMSEVNPNELAYLDLLRDVREHGRRVPTRATLKSTGEKVEAMSVFGRQVRFDLAAGFPLLTTKRMDFDAIVHELIWFLSGKEDIRYLRENGVHIWDAWASADGSIGPGYGKQWRRWYEPNSRTWIDQIATVVRGIEATLEDPADPAARRLIVSAWNVGDLPFMALPPCHVLFQFHVDPDRKALSCHLYMRSADLFLGVPYNIASYALLTEALVDTIDGLDGCGELVISFGDAHIYANHLDRVDEQLGRSPFAPPVLWLDTDLRSVFGLHPSLVTLLGYRSHPALRGEVAV